MELPYQPTNPVGFAQLMNEIWEGETLYDWWHDAMKVARVIGLRRTGFTQRGVEKGEIYRFPTDEGVWIKLDGSAIDIKVNRVNTRID